MTILFLQTVLFNMSSVPLVRRFQNLLFNENHNEEFGHFSSLEVKKKKGLSTDNMFRVYYGRILILGLDTFGRNR